MPLVHIELWDVDTDDLMEELENRAPGAAKDLKGKSALATLADLHVCEDLLRPIRDALSTPVADQAAFERWTAAPNA